MKSSRQQKRKITEVDECLAVSVKKSANGSGRGHKKSTEHTKMPQLEPQIQLRISPATIKLQLFPINQDTRLGLEKDVYNPFLELSLSRRKKIASVIRRLNAKWGSSSVATGELMLFPFNTQLEQLASCKRWTLNDSAITTGEVYVTVGSPSLFRLRYGWCSGIQLEMVNIRPRTRPPETIKDSQNKSTGFSGVLETNSLEEKEIAEANEDIQVKVKRDVNEPKAFDVRIDHMDDKVNTDVAPVWATLPWDDCLTNLSIGGLLSEISLQGKFNGSHLNSANKSSMQENGLISDISIGGLLSEASLIRNIRDNDTKLENNSTLQPILLTSSDVSIGGLFSEASLLSSKSKLGTQTMEKDHKQLPCPWDDSLITLSIGGLLSEASLQANLGCNSESKEKKSNVQPSTTFSNSFDAFIASQFNGHSQALKPAVHEQSYSLLDAEETCHAFPVRKLKPSSRDAMSSDARTSSNGCSNGSNSTTFQFPNTIETNNETIVKKTSRQQLKMNPLLCSLRAVDEDSSLGMSSKNQNESRGPF